MTVRSRSACASSRSTSLRRPSASIPESSVARRLVQRPRVHEEMAVTGSFRVALASELRVMMTSALAHVLAVAHLNLNARTERRNDVLDRFVSSSQRDDARV